MRAHHCRFLEAISPVLALGLLLGCGGGGESTNGGGGNNPPPGPRTVSGTATYDAVPPSLSGLDFARSASRPIRGAVVQVMQGSTVLATTSTDEAGRYSATYTPSGSGQLGVAVLARTHAPSIQLQDNTSAGAQWGMLGSFSASDTTRNLHATHGWNGSSYAPSSRLAAPFAILDAMYTASRTFLAVRPSVSFPALKVNWSPENVPQSGNKAQGQIGTSHFAPNDGQIYILGKAGADTDEFDRHVIVHEWGHYFENGLSRSDSPGGPHGNGDILDPRLAFGEGYGNALSGILLHPDTLYVDTSWGGSSQRAFGFDVDVEPAPSDDPNPGPFSETTVMRVLYHVVHRGRLGGAWDQVGIGLGPVYDVLTGPQKNTEALTTIGSFIAGLKAQPGTTAGAVDALLANFGIGPIASEWGDGDPSLRAMYTEVPGLPFTANVAFGGAFDPNKWAQNQFFRVTGTGGPLVVRTSCAQDVDVRIYRRGVVVAAGTTDSGNETVTLANSQAGAIYVVVVTGFGEQPGDYPVAVNIANS